MTATGHAVIGTLIAAKFGNPAIAVPIALISHIAADLFPHWDTGTNHTKKTEAKFFLESAADVFISYALTYFLIQTFFPNTSITYAFIIVFAAQFLDWATAPLLFFNLRIPPFTWIYNFQKSFDNRQDKPWGIINQVAILLFLFFIAVKTP